MLFISGTGTGVGKTWVTRGLACALSRRGADVIALKPFETGCDPDPADAMALARACGHPELARVPGLYRARPPLAPWAATLEGEPSPDVDLIVAACRSVATNRAVTLVEGAGGLFVPLDAQRDMADLALSLGARALLVARDGLGVLSDLLAVHALASTRGVDIAAVVLTAWGPADPSRRTNRRVLEARLPCPVVPFGACEDEDESLARAAAPLVSALFG